MPQMTLKLAPCIYNHSSRTSTLPILNSLPLPKDPQVPRDWTHRVVRNKPALSRWFHRWPANNSSVLCLSKPQIHLEEGGGCFLSHKVTTCFIWLSFFFSRGLDETAPIASLSTKPLSDEIINYLTAYYGPNLIDVPLTPILVKLIREVNLKCT